MEIRSFFIHDLFTSNLPPSDIILPLIPKQLNLSLSGRGIGRYGAAQLPDVTQTESGENLPLKGSQLLAGLIFDPTSKWTLYAYYGQEQMDKESSTDAGKEFGYGSKLYNNSGAGTLGGTVNDNINKVSQETAGAWWKFYQGNMGKMQVGLQYSTLRTGTLLLTMAALPQQATTWPSAASLLLAVK